MLDLYSYRKRVAAGDVSDVFVYDELPEALRVQISLIWRDAIGPFFVGRTRSGLGDPPNNSEGWIFIHNTVARERGVFVLGNEVSVDDRCEAYLLRTVSVEEALDVIEASFLYIDKVARGFISYDQEARGIRVAADAAIDELNERFRRAGVGYQFEGGQIIRVDSELVHREVVRPVLRYLHERGFEGPRDEFLRPMPTIALARRRTRSQTPTMRSKAR